ncbi:MAG TPA: hypothetical protein DCE23_08380 [Firmicutes bacterium]|nr:hypothetical protein [Bacillota bacterium]
MDENNNFCSNCGIELEKDNEKDESEQKTQDSKSEQYDWSGVFLLLALISIVLVPFIGLIGFVIALVFIVTGKMCSPKNKTMPGVFYVSVTIFAIILFIVASILYMCMNCSHR